MKAPGTHMRAEIAEAPAVFARAVTQEVALPPMAPKAIYTIARGSSDAAATILAYEFMRETGLPMTSLPPSVFSVGKGVALGGALALVVSQSGGSQDLVLSTQGARAQGAQVLAITNVPGSAVESAAGAVLPIGAGPELAVPATKTVVGAVGAGMALLSHLAPGYAPRPPPRPPHWPAPGRWPCRMPMPCAMRWSPTRMSMSSAATPAMARPSNCP
jgi:glucosamine--fructose-6-phosphate aminotransferase (isomerizing)